MSTGLTIPTTTMEWMDAPRNEMDIRYSMVVEDAIRAAKKPYFDPKKLMKVYMHVSLNVILIFRFVLLVRLQLTLVVLHVNSGGSLLLE